MSSTDERRHFTRLPLDRSGTLTGPDGAWSVAVEDIALKGVLVHLPQPVPALDEGATHELSIALSDDTHIEMTLTLIHQRGPRAGFRCRHIELDSITHLRRLVELNLGDPALLERELQELAAHDS